MPRNGSGSYSLPSGNPVVTGSVISSTTHNNTMSDIATALTNSVAKDGQTTPTANLPMGNYKHTGVGAAAARTDYARAAEVQDGTLTHLSSVSGADTITASAPLSMSAYATGQKFSFVSAGANTGAVTLNINSIGAKSITKSGTTALVAGDIPNGAVAEVLYDGTRFQLLGVGLKAGDIGVTVQAYDADTLKADTADNLTAGFTATDYDAGTKSSGTFTPDPANGNFQYAVNGGAHTLAPPSASCTMIVQYTNNGSAGAITTSGFTKVSGSFTTTNGDDFLCYITRCNGFTALDIKALQ